MNDKVKQVVAHPGSVWATIGAVAIAMITSWSDSGSVRERIADFAYETESSHYEAILDLRKKVDFLHTRLIEFEMSVKGNEVVRPPGPAEEPPPRAEADAGSTEAPDATPSPPDASATPESKPEELEPEPVQKKLNFNWKTINRPKKPEKSK